MYRIVINLCLDRIKTMNRSVNDMPVDFQDQLTGEVDVEDQNIKKQLVGMIAAMAAELAPRQRAVFVLRDLQDLNVAEVADILGVSKSSVKTNLCYARQNIRKRLEQLEKKRRR
jgi:RNA polymerase sigma-70 factor (ECF subfamily)